MVKYLTSEKKLSDTRTPDTDVAVVFEFDLSDMIKTIYETCQNMVKIASSDNGDILVDEYSMDDQTPTDNMKNQLFNNAAQPVMDRLWRLISDNVVSDSTGGFSVEYSSSVKKARFPIDNVDSYDIGMLMSVDRYIGDMLIYGTLSAWFTAVNGEQMRQMSASKYNEALSGFISHIKPLFRRYRFNKVKNYK